MSKIKEHFLNNLTDDEAKEKVEDEILYLEYLWEIENLKGTSTSQ